MASQQGWSQQTPAIKAILGAAMKAAPRVRRAASKVRKAASKVKRTVRRVKKAKARLVKGSKAAKAYMAKIRKLRK